MAIPADNLDPPDKCTILKETIYYEYSKFIKILKHLSMELAEWITSLIERNP